MVRALSTGAMSGDRLAAGIDEPHLGGAAGLEPDGDRPAGRRLAREVDGNAELALRFEKVKGDLSSRIEPVELEMAVVNAAVVLWATSSDGHVLDQG